MGSQSADGFWSSDGAARVSRALAAELSERLTDSESLVTIQGCRSLRQLFELFDNRVGKTMCEADSMIRASTGRPGRVQTRTFVIPDVVVRTAF